MKKKYSMLAGLNLMLGIIAICLYLPYTLEAFNMAGFEWFKFVPKMLKNNYGDVLIYFGIFLLLWIIVLNLISILSHCNLPKILLKISAITALLIPLIYVLAFKNDSALKFWINNIGANIKTISFVFLAISWGCCALGLLLNFTRDNHANMHHILQALFMCVLFTLLVATQGWCGWQISKVYKLYGLLIGWMAIYLPISSIILLLCRNKRT